MKKTIVATLALAAAASAHAQVPDAKAGLWETKIVKNVVDGKDMSAQMNDAMAAHQAQLDKLTPEQRAMVMSRMNGMGGNSAIRTCISPAMAAKHDFGGDAHGHCPSADISVSGNTITFNINCTNQGRTIVGKGQAVMSGDTISRHIDVKETDDKGSHTAVIDMQSTYLGSDCKGVKPLDQK